MSYLPRVSFVTFGCRLNQSETSILAKTFQQKGYQITTDQENLDVCVINTCTVTHQSDLKCRKAIRSIRRKNPQAKIAVIGCYAQMSGEQIAKEEQVDLVLGNQEKMKLEYFLDKIQHSNIPFVHTPKIKKDKFQIESIGQYTETTRANLKVQDGCNFICSFCIIPFARGVARSRDFFNLLDEAKVLAKLGFKEIILTGVNIGTYQDQHRSFLHLLDALQHINGIERIRISSIEPTTISSEIFQLMQDYTHKLVPYLHLPLQSADNKILKLMRRKYTFETYRSFVEEAIKEVPSICIGSDLMVGFPEEDESSFENTLSNLQDIPLHYFHVFSYSERKGTHSVKLSNKNKPSVISKRSLTLRNLSNQKKINYMKQFLNKKVSVLYETEIEKDQWQGYSENYIRVITPSKNSLKNNIIPTEIRDISGYYGIGSIL